MKLEVKGKLGEAIDMWNQRWMHVYNRDLLQLESTPAYWLMLAEVDIPFYFFSNLEVIEWHYFSNVVVLEFDGFENVEKTLILKGMMCLRILQI